MLERLQSIMESTHWSIVTVVGILLLISGGRWLVHGTVSLARRMGVSTLVIGLTIVAFGTSLPELVFNVYAALGGHSDLSFGNVVGSNIANLGLVLGLAGVLFAVKVNRRVISHEMPRLIVITVVCVALAFIPPAIRLGDMGFVNGFSRLDGVVMIGMFGLMLVSWYRAGRRHDSSDVVATELQAEAEQEKIRSLPISILMIVAGIVLLAVGGRLTEDGAVRAASAIGLSESLIGLTIIAVATSLPELFTTLSACRAGHSDLAVGNVFGSNIFNLLLVLGVTSTISPVPIPATTGLWDLMIMLTLTIILAPIAWFSPGRIGAKRGGLLLSLYILAMAFGVLRETILRDVFFSG